EDDSVVMAMRSAVSIGETYFFRAPRQLQRLKEIAQRHLIEAKRRQKCLRLRLWSVACATGEEAYTLAILFQRAAPDFDVQVVGTDMNEAALQVARAGVYPKRALRNTHPRELAGGFHRIDERWVADRRLKNCVSFVRLNVVTDRLPAAECNLYGFDVVVCRN